MRKAGFFAAAAATLMMMGAAHADPVSIRIHWSVTPAHITPLMPHAPKEIYKHYGKSYVVEPQRMRGSGPALQAIAANELQLAGISAQALVLGVNRAKLDLVAIAQLMSGGVEGYGASEFWARKGEVKSLEDLRGKVVAVNAFGSTIDAAVIAQFKRAGMERGRDFQVVEVRFPAMLGALEAGRVALAPLLTPANLMAERSGKFEMVFDMRDALGATETLIWVGRRDWVEKNRAALVDFLEDNIRFRQWLNDPANRDEVLALLVKVTRGSLENYSEWAFTNKDNYRHPQALIDVGRLQKNIDDLHELGVLDARIDVTPYVDMSLAQEAAKRVE